MSNIKWVLSDDPSDWAAQIAALFTAASAALTAIYVWLTFHLMRWTARTATLSLQEHHNLRLRRLAPLHAVGAELGALGDELKFAAATHDLMRISGLASKLNYAWYSLDSYVETSRQESADLYEALTSMRASVRAAADTVVVALRDGISEALSAELSRLADDIGSRARRTVLVTGVELERTALH
jgi:hypothetical protein